MKEEKKCKASGWDFEALRKEAEDFKLGESFSKNINNEEFGPDQKGSGRVKID